MLSFLYGIIADSMSLHGPGWAVLLSQRAEKKTRPPRSSSSKSRIMGFAVAVSKWGSSPISPGRPFLMPHANSIARTCSGLPQFVAPKSRRRKLNRRITDESASISGTVIGTGWGGADCVPVADAQFVALQVGYGGPAQEAVDKCA